MLTEGGFIKNDINSLIEEFRNTLIEQIEDFLEYIKNKEDSIIEKNLNN